MGNLHSSGYADITVASVQSIISKDRMVKFDPARFKMILVDEAHHIVASSYLRVLDHFGLQSDDPDPNTTPALVGVSATFSRHDGYALGKAIKHIVYHKDYIDMIGEKWLSNVVFTTVESKAKLAKVKTSKTTGDFLSSSLSAAVNNDESNLITVRAWLNRAGDRKSTLVFCVDLNHLTALTNTFRAHGIDARFVTGETPRPIRSERLDSFRAGDFPVLLNVGVFTEGTDIPNIDCVILARPTKSRNLLVQMIGRGMRLHPGKDNCHIIDMVASLEGGIITTPTLFGLDPDLVVDASSPHDMQKRVEQKRRDEATREATIHLSNPHIAQDAHSSTITFTDYASVADLVADTSHERHIRALSHHAWVSVGPDRFILSGDTTGSYVSLEHAPPDPLWHVTVHTRLPADPASPAARTPAFRRPRRVATAETFESALRAADTFAASRFPHALITRRRPAAAWRDRPASPSQLDFLNKQRDGGARWEARDVTRGEAGDAITKIRHGARGWFKQIEMAKRRRATEARKGEAERERREREVVRVGPVGGGVEEGSDELRGEGPG